MPKQQKLLQFRSGGAKVSVLKSYDRQFAREAFNQMDEAAQLRLANCLDIEGLDPDAASSEDALWDELVQQSREDWNLFSFFIVRTREANRSRELYVSPDWPSAEAFANSLQAP